jgi:hypothetical protein
MVALLQERSLSKDSPEMIEFFDRCLQMAGPVKSGLNYSMKPDASPVKILGELLGQVGLSLICTRTRIDGKQVRTYQIDSTELADLKTIAETRFQKGIDRSDQGESHPSDKTIQRGVTHPQNTPIVATDEAEVYEYEYIPTDEAEVYEYEYIPTDEEW